MFAQHLFAYRVEGGFVRSVSSPLLDAEVTGPALLAAMRPGWQKVEEDYREALAHQKTGDVGLAINSARPERFGRQPPRLPELPVAAWINKPTTQEVAH